MKQTKKLLVAACIFAFVFSLVNMVQPTQVMAAAKPKLSSTKLTVPLGEGGNYRCYWVFNSNEEEPAMYESKPLTVKNKIKGATYTFKSSNTKVAKVNAKSGVITGVKAGTAKITCTQKLKGKTTTVGTCKVTVKNPKLSMNAIDLPMGTGVYWDSLELKMSYGPTPDIEYKDLKFELNSDGLSFTFDSESGGYKYVATKTGVYNATVSYRYNKKWMKVGTAEFQVRDVEAIDYECDWFSKGNVIMSYPLLKYCPEPYDPSDYIMEAAKDGVLGDWKKTDDGAEGLEIIGEGVTTVKIYKKDGTYIGTSTVTISLYNY